MKRELESCDPKKSLRDVLTELGPSELAPFLPEGPGRVGPSPGAPGRDLPGRTNPGFRLRLDRRTAPAEPLGEGRWRLGGSEVYADVRIERSAELAALVQSVTLRNEGRKPSPPIDELSAYTIPLEVTVRDRPWVLSMGGGTTNGFYPPPAYQEHRISFGQPMEWEDPEPCFTRWWVAQRFYRMTSTEDGRSSSTHWPVMLAGWRAGEGTVGIWTALEWSGRWEMAMDCMDDWRFVLRGGPRVNGMVLDPGETIRLPRVHIGVFGGPGATMEDGANSVRRYVAQAIAPDVQGRRPWPYAAYHHWFGIEENVNERVMMEQAERAAELGLEFLEVDSSWYGGASENFANGVGNWERVDEKKFPNGLEPLARAVKEKGIGFGLWFEPERGRRGSDWVREHPDWYWSGKSPVNFHLDLTRKEVQDGLIEMLSKWIEKLDIRWLRWDNNQVHGPYWDQEDPTGKVQFAYVEGLYRVYRTLVERHPNLMIDNCAGGGNRSDFGTLGSSGTMVVSDHAEDPHICRIMQTGGARFLPGNYMNSSIYSSERDPDSRTDAFSVMSRMAGAISLSGHISHWSGEHTREVRYLLHGFKRYRHLLMEDFHRLTPYPRSPEDWDVVEFLDPESGEAVVLAYRCEGSEDRRVVIPKRLAAAAVYRVVDPFSENVLESRSGAELMRDGLSFSLGPNSAEFRHLKPGSGG